MYKHEKWCMYTYTHTTTSCTPFAYAPKCLSPIATGIRSMLSSATSSPHTVLVGEMRAHPAARMAARDSSGILLRTPVIMSDTEIPELTRLSSPKNVLPGVVVVQIVGVEGREGGAAGSLRAGSLGFRLASMALAFSNALPHSRHVFLHTANRTESKTVIDQTQTQHVQWQS